MKIVLFVLLVGYAFCREGLTGRPCDETYEFSCVNGQCIGKLQWCDAVVDCRDNSDEYFCAGNIQCMVGLQFTCSSGRCIPLSGECDGHADCPDASDEDHCESASTRSYLQPEPDLIIQPLSDFVLVTNYSSALKQAISKASAYLVNQRHSDYGWSSSISTSRAIVALAFAEKIERLDETQKILMNRQLIIQLSLDLMAIGKTSLSHLALNINALLASCQDPRNFQGKDLVGILRTRTISAMNSNFSLPVVLLTLCTAGENIDGDLEQLNKMYYIWGMDRLGSKALALMAMVCSGRRNVLYYKSQAIDFFSRIGSLEASNTDVYTKALIMQAFNAVKHLEQIGLLFNHDRSVDELLALQLQDGSFGDLLATYYAIPALLGTTLLDLKCKHANLYEGMLGDSFSNPNDPVKQVTYTLRIPTDEKENENFHSTLVHFSGNKTFYDVMKMAAARDPMFRFMYDEGTEGKVVYSLAGIPNDAETGMAWTLYRMGNKQSPLEKGVDRIFPRTTQEFIFWLKRN